jgi:hypothetical protein
MQRLALSKHLNVLHRQLLEQELIAGSARWVASTRLAVAKHRERNAGGVQQLGNCLRSFLCPVFKCTGASHPEEPLNIFERFYIGTKLTDREW